MSGLKKISLFSSLLLMGLCILAVGFWGKGFVTQWAHEKAEQVLQTKVDFSDLKIDLQSGDVILDSLQIYHPDRKGEKIGEMQKMIFHLESFSDLFHSNKPVEIKLEHPKIIFTTTRSGDWELSERIPLIRRGSGEARLTPFNIDKISVEDGQLEFRDGRMGTLIRLSKIQFHADHFQLPTLDNPLPVLFDAHFIVGNSGEMQIMGKGDFLSPKTSMKADLKAEALPLPPYATYYETGLPVHVRSGIAFFNAKVECNQDILRVPIHASVSGLQVELKKNKSLGFVANYKIDSMKNERGMIETDLLVTGDLRRPQLAFLTKFDASMSVGMKAVGHKIKSGFGKVKNFFSPK